MTPDSHRRGFLFALAAYGLWGLAPVYFKWLSHVDATEIIAHRMVWSLLLLLGIILATGKLRQARGLLPKFHWLIASALFISANWLIFVWAVTHNRISETSLGYYINPLVSVLLARLFLGERLRPLQGLAFAVAVFGVLVRLLEYGQLPWVSLALAFCFGFYGLVRKHIAAPAVTGLWLETLVMAPVAIFYLLWLNNTESLVFTHRDWQTDVLLIAGGLVTTIPLLCFAAAVARLTLISIGMLQYITPSLSLILAVWWYREPFSTVDLLSFVLIWLALIVFTWDSYWWSRRYRQSLLAVPAKE